MSSTNEAADPGKQIKNSRMSILLCAIRLTGGGANGFGRIFTALPQGATDEICLPGLQSGTNLERKVKKRAGRNARGLLHLRQKTSEGWAHAGRRGRLATESKSQDSALAERHRGRLRWSVRRNEGATRRRRPLGSP